MNRPTSPPHTHPAGWRRAAQRVLLWRVLAVLLLLGVSLPPVPTPPAQASESTSLAVQAFLDQQPGVLKSYTDNGSSAATIIESNSLYYGLSPHILLALLETTGGLLTNPTPDPMVLRYPFGLAGPEGFAKQIEWASRELRAGLGPYERAPALVFSDGKTLMLDLNQPPEGIAIQRFLAQGRTQAEWEQLHDRIGQIFTAYFHSTVAQLFSAPTLTPPPAAPEGSPQTATGFLYLPWPSGTNVIHTAWFDHAYPMVDVGYDGNTIMVTYRGIEQGPYNGHDGHDYYFPDQPIGTPILAAAAGIAYARRGIGSAFGGNGVVILHPNGYETVYWHLDQFAPIFAGVVNSNQGVRVNTGDFIGTSGATGCGGGCDAAHLHFEVRYQGRQVDPYGWYGVGPDPCERYAGCAPSVWLWHASLRGTLDFTPPNAPSDARYEPSTGLAPHTPPAATTQAAAGDSARYTPTLPDPNAPPIATLTINPPHDLLLQVHFDGTPLQQVGTGFAHVVGSPTWHGGRYALAIGLPPEAELAYPAEGNLAPQAGTISVWVYVPDNGYPQTFTNRHYVVSASATPHDTMRIYPGTLALRRVTDPGGRPFWDFWTVSDDGRERHELRANDTLAPGWHHLALTWDLAAGHKALYLDGSEAASISAIRLPTRLGEALHVGRFTHGSDPSGLIFDELLIYRRVLSAAEMLELAQRNAPLSASAVRITTTTLQLDLNASTLNGAIMAVQLGRDGVFSEPQPYNDTFAWELPPVEGTYELGVRLLDQTNTTTRITRTVSLDLAPVLSATLQASTLLTATLALTATDLHQPLEMQISPTSAFSDTMWQAYTPTLTLDWQWLADPAERAPFYVRVRDAGGQVSQVVQLDAPITKTYLPLVVR